ncbi:hypothetical protein GQ464_016155 [Rhodocaloribacter litoris]|uniref:hypothetical protein n=1 Tax=Rhodocaloribacter litoris TaxID=2558931 RepID=UPI001420B2B0|nr:hypothetical protein [Rhodocaloribacter litoris]QXD14929.1 hypothetical protein GQ464_016155 [Rhodocaloribacter litoris]
MNEPFRTSGSEQPEPRTDPRVRLWNNRTVHLGLLIMVLFTASMMIFAGMDLLARNLLLRLRPVQTIEAVPVSAPAPAPAPAVFTFEDLDLHPDRLHAPFLSGSLAEGRGHAAHARRLEAFHDLLDLYEIRQRYDDNFTIRVLDSRTNETLEVFSLDHLRQAYEQGKPVDWREVDRLRTTETRRLSKKYQDRGIPGGALMIRWGRANQVREAREREAAYLAYEVALARQLGLSLLATEIGTVETFNEDHLVSTAGARSRYQLMPYLLRQNGIEHYELRTGSGRTVKVYEEWHPLLTMEPAFELMRAYANAVGHELPGLSAYHTGPFNIFKLYQSFLTSGGASALPEPHVVDAFIWGLTDGFERVSGKSSFKERSRGYVPALYGSFRATASLPIDTSQTVRAERVRLKPGQSLFLSDLLRALEATGQSFAWGPDEPGTSFYNHFRRLNPHIVLPAAPDSAGVPLEGDVRLVDRAAGARVSFFLPPGAAEALARHGLDVFDPAATFRFDHGTFDLAPGEKTPWDSAYEALVEDIGYFGFTRANRAYLDSLRVRFQALAERYPTPYRLRQLRIIEMHARVWASKFWDQLAQTVEAYAGQLRAPVRPPMPPESLRNVPEGGGTLRAPIRPPAPVSPPRGQ